MNRLNFTVCGDASVNTVAMGQLLMDFTESHLPRVEVVVTPVPWESYRHELTSRVIHNCVGDISQAGAPVASDMMAMNALRPFSPHDVEQMGGKTAFVPIAWKNTPLTTSGEVWAIPWLTDPRVFIYWRDILEQADIDESVAFDTPCHFFEAAERMQMSGIPKPWGITIDSRYSALHTVASWIWASGGEFISDDEKRTLILEPEAMEGFKAYFNMARFVEFENLSPGYPSQCQTFIHRKTAVILGNAEIVRHVIDNIPAKMRSKLGAAFPFGVPFVGGSNLLIWAASQNGDRAVQLVRYLTGEEAQTIYPISIDFLPVRLDVLNRPPYTTDPILKVLTRALQCGRVFPRAKLSGLFEDRLGSALVKIWKALFVDSSANVEALITENLTPVARQYESWME